MSKKRNTCKVSKCSNRVKARGLCDKHYKQFDRKNKFKKKSYHRRNGLCCVQDCKEAIYANGFCNKHYQRVQKHGSPLDEILANKTRNMTLRQRIRYYGSHYNKKTECFEWTGPKDQDGYGVVWWKNYPYRAHRISYELYNEPVPKGKIICHHCDNPSCVNPDHLYAGTHKTNAEDKVKRGRLNTPKGENSKASKLTKEQAIEVIKRRKSGEKAGNIAQDYGISSWTIFDIMKGNSWEELDEYRNSIPNTAKLDKIGRIDGSKSKLTDEQKREVIKRHKNGESLRGLEKDYSVTETTLRRICKQ